jgi:uncharacterized membrane protein
MNNKLPNTSRVSVTPASRGIAVPAPWPRVAMVFSILLVVFGLAWELVFDPLRPGGSWLALKVIPLALIIPGLARGRMQSFRVGSLLIWLYVGEALVRVMGLSASEQSLAAISLVLSALLAFAILVGARKQMRVATSVLKP